MSIHSHTKRGWLVASSAILALAICVLFALQSAAVNSQNVPASGANLFSLLIGQDDLPYDPTLFSHESFPDLSSPSFHEAWFGAPTGELHGAHGSIEIGVCIAESPDHALKGIERALQGVAIPPKEVSGREPFSSFSDRAWYANNGSPGLKVIGGRLLFIRNNVKVDLFMFNKNGLDEELLFTLAERISSKIGAALSGRPEPVSVLPLAADQELRVSSEDAWKMRDLGKRLWGNEAVTIAIYDEDGIPRSIPAKRLGANDYIVPLRHVAAILGPRSPIKMEGDEVKTNIKGKPLVFGKGKSQARLGKQTVQLSRPVEFADGEVLIPLVSVIHSALSKQIAWEDRGSIKIGRVR